MKNIFKTLCFIAFVFIGTTSIEAQTLKQDANTPEAAAKKTTESLTSTLGLNGDQQRSVFRALMVKESNYIKDVYGKDEKTAAVQVARKKHDEVFDVSMKKVLTEQQYQMWLKYKNQ